MDRHFSFFWKRTSGLNPPPPYALYARINDDYDGRPLSKLKKSTIKGNFENEFCLK